MNLSPEEKKIGKENFQEAVGTTRRDFLKEGIVATVAAGSIGALGGYYFGYQKVNNPLRVGVIGTGDEGNVLIGALNPEYIDLVAVADIRPYSVHRAFHGDWYSPGAHSARPGLLDVYKKAQGWTDRAAAEKHVKVYSDGYDALLDDPNVEAVIIALPLHLHHPAALAAMRKGKHVLTEKLMAHDVGQCKEMARAAKQLRDAEGNPIILAVGHQRHYSILYDNAVDQIKQGLIGKIHHIRAQWHRNNLPGNDSWQPPLPTPFMSEEEFKTATRKSRESGQEAAFKTQNKLIGEYYAWLAASKDPKLAPKAREEWNRKVAQKLAQINDVTDEQAAKFGYEAKSLEGGYNRSALEELIRWRLWQRTGGGLMAELGSHQLDAASIFLTAQRPDGRKAKPLSVVAVGGRSIFPEDRECEDHVYCNFEFPGNSYYENEASHKVANPNDKIVVTYSSINGNGFGGWGEVVFGDKGTLILEQEQDAMLYAGANTGTKVEVKAGKDGKPSLDTYETGGGAAVAQAATAEVVSRGYREEIEHWAWCIRNPSPEHQPRCKPEVAMADAIIALTTNLAIAKGGRIDFEPEWFDVESDATPDGSKPASAANLT
jgi:predicted dehydrogenase